MNNIIIQNEAALSKVPIVQVLREGSFVFVRILDEFSKGNYEALINGTKIKLKSKLPLQVGKGYTAIVEKGSGLNDKKQIILKLDADFHLAFEGDLNSNNQILTRKMICFSADGKILDSQIAAWFKKNGLLPDKYSFTLLNVLKKSGMKFDPCLIMKARRIGMEFLQNQMEASVIALFMLQKGLQPSKKSIKKIMGKSFFESQDKNCLELIDDAVNADFFAEKNDVKNDFAYERKKNGKNQSFSDDESFLDKTLPLVFKNFFESFFVENKIDEVSKDFSKKNPNLSLFNHMGFNMKNVFYGGTLVRIPFDFNYSVENQEKISCSELEYESKISKKNGSGELNLFYDFDRRKIEEISIKFDFFVTVYKIVLYFKLDKVQKINIFLPLKDFVQKTQSMDFFLLGKKLNCDDVCVFPLEDESDSLSFDFDLALINGSV